MSSVTTCDWCGREFRARQPRVHFGATIWRYETEETYSNRGWKSEDGPAMHFCVDERLDLNRLGLSDVNLEDESESSCFRRATAMLKGRESEPPGMGLEWRLVPVAPTVERPDEPPRRASATSRRPEWPKIPLPDREREVLEVLSVHRLTIRELTERLEGAHPEVAVYESQVRSVITRLYHRRDLGREVEAFRGTQTRYRYFKVAPVEAPVVGVALAEGGGA